jgi:hypothetical protein
MLANLPLSAFVRGRYAQGTYDGFFTLTESLAHVNCGALGR